MIDRTHALKVSRQCELLDLQRSTFYYKPKADHNKSLKLMRKIDALHLDFPWMGSRSIRDHLARGGIKVCRDRLRDLMRKMGIHAIYRAPRTSIPFKGHKIYPYLLRDLAIDRPNQVWATDITYIPMAKGFAYLVAIMDWASRKVLAWRISNTLTTDFCIDAIQEAIDRYGKPEIFNTDQGSQFTSEDFTGILKENGIQISMDGKGRWVDNVFVERLWRSVKYENVYLRAYESMAALREGIKDYFLFYNTKRTHQSLAKQTPDEVYFKDNGLKEAA
jgi:putative transposase